MKSECEEISKRYMMLTEKFNALRANAEEQLNLLVVFDSFSLFSTIIVICFNVLKLCK